LAIYVAVLFVVVGFPTGRCPEVRFRIRDRVIGQILRKGMLFQDQQNMLIQEHVLNGKTTTKRSDH